MWDIIASILGSKNQTGQAPIGGTRGWQGWMGGGPSMGGMGMQGPSMGGGVQGWLQQLFGGGQGMMTGGVPSGAGQVNGVPVFGAPPGLATIGVSSPGIQSAAQQAGWGGPLQAGNQAAEMTGLAGTPAPLPETPQTASPWLDILARAASQPVHQTGMVGGQTRGALPGFQPQMPTFRFNSQGFLTRGGM